MKKILLLLTVFAVTLSLGACNSKVSKEKEEAILKSVQEWAENVDENFKISAVVELNMNGLGLEMNMEVLSYDGVSAFTKIEAGGLFDAETYTVKNNDGTYTVFTYNAIFGSWIREDLEVAPENNTSAEVKEIFEDTFLELLKYTGSEKKDGKSYDVLVLEFNEETYKKLAEASGTANDMVGDINFDDIGNFVFKLLVSEEGAPEYLVLEMEAEGVKINAELRMYDYGKVEEIVVPQNVIDEAKTMDELMN